MVRIRQIIRFKITGIKSTDLIIYVSFKNKIQ